MGFLFIHGLYYHRIDINPQYARYPVNSRVFSNNKTNPQISDVLNYEKSQDDLDLQTLEILDPYKDISKIKALVRKHYAVRRHIQQTTCDKVKGIYYINILCHG